MADIKLSDIFGGVGGMSDQVVINKNDITQLKSDLGLKLNKAGDAMTGTLGLNASSKQVTFVNSSNYISMSGNSLYLAANNSGGLVYIEGQAHPKVKVGSTVTDLYHGGNKQKDIPVNDVRGEVRQPSYFTGKTLTSWFNNTGMPTSGWHSGIHVKGWEGSYNSWELFSHSSTGASDNKLYFRTGLGDSWNPTYEVYHSGRKPSPGDLGAYTKTETDNLFTKKAGDTYTGQLAFNSSPATSSNQSHIFHNGNGASGTPINIRSMREHGSATWVWEKVAAGELRYSTGTTGAGTDQITLSVSTGRIFARGEFRSSNPDNYRTVYGGYGSFWRQDGNAIYLMFTNKDDAYGSYNNLRPFKADIADGNVTFGHTATGPIFNTTGSGTGQGFAYHGKTAIGGNNDTWLRINPHNQFSNGIYCGNTGTLRHDNSIQRGQWGTQGSACLRPGADTSWGAAGDAAFSYTNGETSAAHWILGSYTNGSSMRAGIQILSSQSGNMRFYTNMSSNFVEVAGGNFLAQNNVTAYSDIRVKKNIKAIDNALEKTLKLNGVTYDRTDQDNVRQVGLIAQEVEKVLPEAVITTVNGDIEDFKSVAYGNLVGLLVEAIKELNTKIEDLESKIKE